MLICKSCGAKNIDGRTFCRVCGDFFPNANTETDEEKKQRETEEKKRKEEKAIVNEKMEILHTMQTDLNNISKSLYDKNQNGKKKKAEDKVILDEQIKTLHTMQTDLNNISKSLCDKNQTDEKKKADDKVAVDEQLKTLHKIQTDLHNISKSLQELKAFQSQKDLDEQKSLQKQQSPKKYRDFFGVHSAEDDSDASPLSRWFAFVLCAFFGLLGLHRYYTKKTVSGIIYTLTCGLLCIGAIVDLILIVCGKFKDNDGLYLKQ